MSQRKWLTTILPILGLCVMIAAPVNAQEGAAQQEPVAPVDLAQAAQPSSDDTSLIDKASYLIGYNFYKQFKQQGVKPNMEKLLEGIKLADEGGDIGMDQEEIRSVMMGLQRIAESVQRKRKAELRAEMEKKGAENLVAGKTFLEDNAKNEGIQTLENGVQYKIISSGDASGAKPGPTDFVKVYYTGTLTDGTKFDGTKEGSPARFPVGGVIKGFSSALMEMRVGDKWKIFIPSDLAYGKRGSPPRIMPNAVLIFDIEMVDIEKSKPASPAPKDPGS